MSGLYLTWMLDVLRNAGCAVAESSVTNGWERRARSSGGFPFMPLGIQWHHTASDTSPANDLSWMINGSDDAPIGNVLLDRTGVYWPVAAGAANTAGKGGPLTMSRGTIAKDSGNSQSFAIECANNGVGQSWPSVQIDAYIRGSNALNLAMGNRPDDVFTHALGEGNGWTDRKIDPATASAVQGPWRPRSVTGSGTWSLTDIRNECNKRAGNIPPIPIPPTPDEDDDMDFDGFWRRDNSEAVYAIYKSGTKQWMTDPGYLSAMQALVTIRGYPDTSIKVQNDPAMFAAFGLVVGPREPGTDEWGNRT